MSRQGVRGVKKNAGDASGLRRHGARNYLNGVRFGMVIVETSVFTRRILELMNDELFNELLESVQEMDAIGKGEGAPSRTSTW